MNYDELTIKIDTDCQISPLIMDYIQPLDMTKDAYLSPQQMIDFTLRPWMKLIDLIMDLGEKEHTHDWDPYISIKFKDGNTLTTQNGYYIMNIQNDMLLLEDEEGAGQEKNDDDSYHIIPINTIASIELLLP